MSMPSTACTICRGRPSSVRTSQGAETSKYRFNPSILTNWFMLAPSGIDQLPGDRSADASAIVQPAGGTAGAGAHQLRPLAQATAAAEGAARIEGTAFGDLGEPRHGAIDLRELVVAHAETRDRAHQPLGIGML